MQFNTLALSQANADAISEKVVKRLPEATCSYLRGLKKVENWPEAKGGLIVEYQGKAIIQLFSGKGLINPAALSTDDAEYICKAVADEGLVAKPSFTLAWILAALWLPIALALLPMHFERAQALGAIWIASIITVPVCIALIARAPLVKNRPGMSWGLLIVFFVAALPGAPLSVATVPMVLALQRNKAYNYLRRGSL